MDMEFQEWMRQSKYNGQRGGGQAIALTFPHHSC